MRCLGLTAVFAALGVSCGPAQNLLPVNDLDRPTDVAFMCFGAYPQTAPADGGAPEAGALDAGGPGLQVSGRPMRACHPQDLYDPGPTTTSRTFAFMANSASGGLTAVDADHWKLLDLDPATGGYGQLPLGQLPEQIAVSDDGCRLISANRGSCDLTLVDPSVLVEPTFNLENPDDVVPLSPRSATQTIRPVKGDGTFLTAAPYEVMFLPQDTSTLVSDPPGPTPTGPLCGRSGAEVDPVGWPAQQKPEPWYALVTYPSCALVALIALPSGQIVHAAYVRSIDTALGKSVTLVDAGKSPVCKVPDCAGQSVVPGVAGAADATTIVEAGSSAGADATIPVEAGPSVADATISVDAGPSVGVDAGPSVGADATVPVEAGVDAAGASLPDAGGTPEAGAPSPPAGAFLGNQFPDVPSVGPDPLRPTSIAITPDGTRAYISISNASYVLSVGLTSAGFALPGNAISLHEGAAGSNRIRLSVDPYRTSGAVANPGIAGIFVGTEAAEPGENQDDLNHSATLGKAAFDPQERKYLYVIARDGTLRVIQVFDPGAERECETNADTEHLAPGTSATTACIPVDPAHRRPFSVGPGIHFPAPPIDVAAADIRVEPTEDFSEQSVNGAHAWVITASGVVYLVNINPVLRKFSLPVPPSYASTSVSEQEPFPSSLRDRNEITYSLTLDPSSGPPRVDVLPSVAATGPYIEPFWTQGAAINATALTVDYVETDVLFPVEPNPTSPNDPIDRRAVTPQTWTVTWEGGLSGQRNGGRVHPEGTVMLPAAISSPKPRDSLFEDGGGGFCGIGVLPGDLLTLTGCTVDSQCGLGEGCLVDSTVTTAAAGVPVTGLCVDPNKLDTQSASCAPFLDSVRRYQIVVANPSQLVIRPHLDELVRSSLTPCHPADPDMPFASDCRDPDDTTTDKFTCETVYPGVGTGPRCLMKGCTHDSDCRIGRNCVDFNTTATTTPAGCQDGHCFCADAPPLDETGAGCFDQLVAYQVNAANGFIVSGSQTGLITTAPQQSDGSCSLDPTQDRRFTFRIPMDAPHCQNIADNSFDTRINPEFVTAKGKSGDNPGMRWTGYESAWLATLSAWTANLETLDPCLYIGGPVGTESEVDPTIVPTSDPTQSLLPSVPQHVRAIFRNAQISFVLANLDRQPTGQFQTSFDVHGGFNPQVIQDPSTVEISMPARIILGPVDAQTQLTAFTPTPYEVPYLFVVDQRRLGRAQGGGPTRGQLLRIHPLGYTSSVGSATGMQPIFQDYTASGGVFPIQ